MDKDTIICWNERDQKEAFQMKHKGRAEITVSFVIWSLSLIVTGHDDGRICLWNSDSHHKLISNALDSPITAMVVAQARKTTKLVAADMNGSIAIWNLSLLVRNPTTLSLEGKSKGFHDINDPSILSLSYDWINDIMFSGGDDCSIRLWHLMQDNTAITYDMAHLEPICALECSGLYLVSGDMSGEVIVWSITKLLHSHSHNSHNIELNRLLQFPAHHPARPVITLLKSPNHEHLKDLWLSIGRSHTLECTVWNIYAPPLVDDDNLIDDKNDDDDDLLYENKKENDIDDEAKDNIGKDFFGNDYWEPIELAEGQLEEEIEFKYAKGRASGLSTIDINKVNVINLEKANTHGEPACMRLVSEDEIGKPNKLYVGTADGDIVIAKLI